MKTPTYMIVLPILGMLFVLWVGYVMFEGLLKVIAWVNL